MSLEVVVALKEEEEEEDTLSSDASPLCLCKSTILQAFFKSVL